MASLGRNDLPGCYATLTYTGTDRPLLESWYATRGILGFTFSPRYVLVKQLFLTVDATPLLRLECSEDGSLPMIRGLETTPGISRITPWRLPDVTLMLGVVHRDGRYLGP